MSLELIQDRPGITAGDLGGRLGVTDRAARRYVAILREAGMPIGAAPGRYGGYRVGRGFRPPPLTFSMPEALGLVMAVLEERPRAAELDDPAGRALAKIIRVLPATAAGPAQAIRAMTTPGATTARPDAATDPETTAELVRACAAARRIRIDYLLGPDRGRSMDVDPWAVAAWRGRWYLLCWSHGPDAKRVLRVDRVAEVQVLEQTFEPPADLDPSRAVEEHMAEGWAFSVEVEVDAPLAAVARWVPRSLGRLEALDERRTRLVGSTEEPEWYARALTAIEAPMRVVDSPELRAAVAAVGERMCAAASSAATVRSHTGPARPRTPR